MVTKYITNIIPTAAPRLPSAPAQYDSRYIEQLNNILRIYFNGIDSTFGGLLADTQTVTNSSAATIVNKPGMLYLAAPYGAFHQDGVTTLTSSITNVSTTPIPVVATSAFPSSGYLLIESEIIQYTGVTSTTFTGITRGVLGTTAASHTSGLQVSEVQGTGSGTTIGLVKFNNTDYSNGVSINSSDTTKFVFSYAGIYNIQISLQLLSYDNAADNVAVWFRLNGTDIANTASIQTVPPKHGGIAGATILTYNIFQQVAPSDYMQLAWVTDSGNSVIATYPAGTSPVHPVSPAVILTAQFVSRTPT